MIFTALSFLRLIYRLWAENVSRLYVKRFKVITVSWCKQPTSNSFLTCLYCVYLFKLYDKSINILLANDLTNISSDISKHRSILWMVFTCNLKANVKGLEEVENLGRNKGTLHRWPKSPEMCDCRRAYRNIKAT